MADRRAPNRGRSAAAGNRRALVAAAVEVLGEHGYHAPLHTVAKRAGVGQGSLYRHFPDRVSLALAVVESDVVDLEELAGRTDTTLGRLLERITDLAIASIAFVDLVTEGATDARLQDVADRVRAVVATALVRGHHRSELRASLTADDVMVAIAMVATLLARVSPADRRATADAAWSLLGHGLRP